MEKKWKVLAVWNSNFWEDFFQEQKKKNTILLMVIFKYEFLGDYIKEIHGFVGTEIN